LSGKGSIPHLGLGSGLEVIGLWAESISPVDKSSSERYDLSRIYCIATAGNWELKHSDGVCGKTAKFGDTWVEKLGIKASEYNHRFRVKITIEESVH
jgi:hypothetical protein